MSEKRIRIAVLCGDRRQKYLASALEEAGFTVDRFGLDREESEEDPTPIVSAADAVVLPLPYSTDGERLFSPLSDRNVKIETVLSKMKEHSLLFAGKADGNLKTLSERYGITLVDYGEDEAAAVNNAIPTAEGAIAIMMEMLPVTVFGTKTAVLGYGRIGRVLSERLRNLGADVSVFARKEADRAYIGAGGMKAYDFPVLSDKIGEMRAVFNTVPSIVITQTILTRSREDCLFIDLASKPGGIEKPEGDRQCRRVISALSLPGRAFPETAGRNIANPIIHALKERKIICSDLQ